ncbi:MAG: hypothetical protein QXV17_05030 [Candidatus Micrarchaeaceae archaeon]
MYIIWPTQTLPTNFSIISETANVLLSPINPLLPNSYQTPALSIAFMPSDITSAYINPITNLLTIPIRLTTNQYSNPILLDISIISNNNRQQIKAIYNII